MHYTLKQLESKPTLEQGHFDDLKARKDNVKVWLSRMTIADGMPYNNQVTIERYTGDRWETIDQYEAR